mgnify:CR=1 FL=1
MADASTLTPAERAAMITRTEDQLLDEYASIVMKDVNANMTSPPCRFWIDSDELSAVFGHRYAFLVARRCRFELSNDGSRWVRTVGPVEKDMELHPVDWASYAAFARRTLDPLGLLDAFHTGAENG